MPVQGPARRISWVLGCGGARSCAVRAARFKKALRRHDILSSSLIILFGLVPPVDFLQRRRQLLRKPAESPEHIWILDIPPDPPSRPSPTPLMQQAQPLSSHPVPYAPLVHFPSRKWR